MLTTKRFILVLLIFVSISSCKDEAKKKIEEKKTEQVTIAIDSGSFKIDKKDFKVKSVVDDVKVSSQDEVKDLVKGEEQDNLNDYQKFVQDFFAASAEKNYSDAAKYLAYRGADKSRNNKVAYNTADANEMKIVKTTVDVIYGFLANSENYKFAKIIQKQTKAGVVQSIEVNFFKKGLGIDRHFFEVINTDKGMLIYNMK